MFVKLYILFNIVLIFCSVETPRNTLVRQLCQCFYRYFAIVILEFIYKYRMRKFNTERIDNFNSFLND